jgi:predicted metal-dependent HD superfamily phosphohydrolase
LTKAAKLAQLQADWRALLRPFAVDEQIADEILADLVARYEENGRYYHNLDHISNVLATVNDLKDQAVDFAAVQLAAWFHDVIYETGAIDNEKRSAAYAVSALKGLNVPEETIVAVKRLILATTTHEATDDNDSQILVDADLATFAAQPEQYERYSRAIRQEFALVPEPVYRLARKKALARFLQRERIFLTEEMFNRLEKRARQNIEREVASLT